MSPTDEPLQTGFDPNDRELCSDGACVGVIGPDGRCKECGKSSPNKTPKAGRKNGADAPVPTSVLPSKKSTDGDAPGARAVEGDSFDPEARELCPDGACIGVIGPDGRCKECGTASPHGPRAPGPTPPDSHGDTPTPDDDTTQNDASEVQESSESSENVEERRLCPDGACIGVIGSNGRCKECGTRAD